MSAEERRRLRKLLEDFARKAETHALPLAYVERALERVIDERLKRIL